MNKFQLFLFSLMLTAQFVSAQDPLSKTVILEKIKTIKTCKPVAKRVLATDTVCFIATCPDNPKNYYFEFYKLGKSNDGGQQRIICQFYFFNDQLIFIEQGMRKKKRFSDYYLDQGKIFTSDLDKALPVLTQEIIDTLKAQLLSYRNTLSK